MGLRTAGNLRIVWECFERGKSILIAGTWCGRGRQCFLPGWKQKERGWVARKGIQWVWGHVHLEMTVGPSHTEISGRP